MAKASHIIGDIGGTNARFALAAEPVPGFSKELELRCADFASAQDAINHYLSESGAEKPAIVCLAAAGPVVDQRVRFTNNHWSLAADELATEFSGSQVRLVNDFEAIAHAVPVLQERDCLRIGSPESQPLPARDYTVAIVGPGTGLGAVGLKKTGGMLVPIPGEAGHIGFAPLTRVQLEVLAVLREQFDRVSTERLVCGPGLENVYWALGRVHGKESPKRSAREIFALASDNSDSAAAEAVELFLEVLGQFAGDFALAIGASDGVYIGGGILPRYPELLAGSGFRSGFENKGRYRSLMDRIATQLIVHKQPGLLGAAVIAHDMASRSQ